MVVAGVLPGEAEDKCCWCFPIKIGVIFLGIWVVIMGVIDLWKGIDSLSLVHVHWVFWLNIVAVAPILLAAFYFF